MPSGHFDFPARDLLAYQRSVAEMQQVLKIAVCFVEPRIVTGVQAEMHA